jgi:hypothetical protein
MKLYFSHYGQLYSLSEQDARKLAFDALEGNYNFSDYKSFKCIKFRELSRHITCIKYGKKFININFCLDWNNEDWANFLESF